MNSKKTFIFIGRSGSGKGTQVKLLHDFLIEKKPEEKIYTYTSGNHFREYIKMEDNYSAQLSRDMMTDGILQPNFLAVWLWANAFVADLTGDEHLIMDGAPRALVEAESLDTAMKFYDRKNPTVIVINLSKEESRKRLLDRKREDDTDESIEERVNWYDSEVLPAVEFYRENPDYNVVDINGEQSIEEVHNEIIEKLNM
jgi:adenylate kinase